MPERFAVAPAIPVAQTPWRPSAHLSYELMFDSKTKKSGRLTDAVDLLIDFATLGEYGLEPVGRTSPSCETRRRTGAPSAPASSPRRREADRPFVLRP
jgi:hypothetical protein